MVDTEHNSIRGGEDMTMTRTLEVDRDSEESDPLRILLASNQWTNLPPCNLNSYPGLVSLMFNTEQNSIRGGEDMTMNRTLEVNRDSEESDPLTHLDDIWRSW